MIPRSQHTTTSQRAIGLMTSWCVKRQLETQYLGLGIATPATSSAFDCSLANPEGAT